jgi:hypothetical protein
METAGEMGLVFAMLLKHREIYGSPPTRPLRTDELRAAKMLANWTKVQLDEFEDFLNSQGLTLIVKNGFDYGVPPKLGVPNDIYILSRQRGGELAPYLERKWFISAMADSRYTKHDTMIFWVARMWLTLQWFFYQKKDRLPMDVSTYRDAFVSETLFIEMLEAGVEKMANAGRPPGERGLMWDALCQGKGQIRTRAKKFLKVMEDAGMVEETSNQGEYRQTLAAAIQMAEMAEADLAYLMPPHQDDLDASTLALLQGELARDGASEATQGAAHQSEA